MFRHALLVAAMLVTTGTAVAADTAPAADCARTGAIFNQPHDINGDDDKIHRHIVCLVEGAKAGSEIRVASYHFAHKEIKKALLKAEADRQVKVKVLVDTGVPGNAADGPIYRELRDAIGEDKGEDSWITTCPGSGTDRACIGSRKMHNKLLLFSETRGLKNVTFLTSSNLQDNAVPKNSGTNMWNSGYTVAGDSVLYQHFLKYFDVLSGWVDGRWQDPANPNYYATVPTDAGSYKVFHSPRKEGNTALDALNKVKCDKNNSGGTNPGNRTIVRVAMWAITGEKDSDPGTNIAKRLWELDNEGCYVDIVADVISDGEHGPLRALLRKPQLTEAGNWTNYHGPEVREFNGDQGRGLHEKNLLIDGWFDGKPDQKVVLTGSYNFTYRSVRVNDETWLQINDPGVHDRFRDNFSDVRNAAHTCWQTSKADGCDGGRAINPDPPAPLNCHETADRYLNAGFLYLYSTNYCDGAHGAKDDSGADGDHGDGKGQIKNYDNKANSIVNTTGKTLKFYNYPNYNSDHPEGDTFCLRPGHWVNRLVLYGDNKGNWQNSISSHRVVDDPDQLCDRWFGGYHEPNRPRP